MNLFIFVAIVVGSCGLVGFCLVMAATRCMGGLEEMTDKERILMHIIREIRTGLVLAHPSALRAWNSEPYKVPDSDRYYCHFAPWDKPKPGDLVTAQSGRTNDEWSICWYVSAPKADDPNGSFGTHVVREIGTGRLCNYSNETFVPIRGLEGDAALLEADQRHYYEQVMRAFATGDEYGYRYGGIRFQDKTVVVMVRQAFGGLHPKGSYPFEVKLPYRKRIAVTTILKLMREQGYGTHQFVPVPVTEEDCTCHKDSNGTRRCIFHDQKAKTVITSVVGPGSTRIDIATTE
jgi:hypothetical protein